MNLVWPHNWLSLVMGPLCMLGLYLCCWALFLCCWHVCYLYPQHLLGTLILCSSFQLFNFCSSLCVWCYASVLSLTLNLLVVPIPSISLTTPQALPNCDVLVSRMFPIKESSLHWGSCSVFKAQRPMRCTRVDFPFKPQSAVWSGAFITKAVDACWLLFLAILVN